MDAEKDMIKNSRDICGKKLKDKEAYWESQETQLKDKYDK